jgi:(1->4)-alpha-D-glucan 1-alpha-D-glucosylmutase
MATQKDNSQITSQITGVIQEIAAQRRIPAATYRLQFHAGFTFNDARALLPYLDDLGISDLYASPIFQPRAGSTHGYDVADPTRLNSDLGSEADFDALTLALQKRQMGFLLDIVPNHMGVNDPRNTWWFDVLENGPSSEYAAFFDIEWHPTKLELENKVLLPILGDQYGVVLERGELRLNYEAGSFYLHYYETTLPISPRTYILLLRLVLEGMVGEAEMAGEAQSQPQAQSQSQAQSILNAPTYSADSAPDPARLELESIITALGYLPERTENDPERLAERVREKEIIKRRLDTLVKENQAVRAALDAVVQSANGQPGKPESFNLLDEVVEAQPYRLAFWRVAGEEINYRRFFDINELAAIRVEEAQVFAATHALAFRLLAEGKATGLRVDHPDGLYDPTTYFCRLQERYLFDQWQSRRASEPASEPNMANNGADSPTGNEQMLTAINAWLDEQAHQPESASWPLYIVVEKILSESEPLPLEWAVYGTTGYAFLAAANGLFVDQRNEKAFTRLYSRFSHNRTTLAELAFTTKMMIMRDSLAGEITTLAYELERIGERNRHYRDFTLGGLRTALREVIASLSIYRTYIDAYQGVVSDRDRKFVQAAVREAKRRDPLLDGTLFDYIRDTLLLHNMNSFAEEDRPRIAHWVMKFQQLTGPVMAKGVEDTAFYRYNRLVSLNEVGDHPSQFGLSVEAFHKENSRRATLWPHTMLATSTHDNKRSEDVRARINVLSEMPDRWQNALRQWSRLNASKKSDVEGSTAPDANDEYLFYQTVLGTWPLAAANAETGSGAQASPWGHLLPPGDSATYQEFRQRISNYMLKAVKEAKVYTSWINPDQEYEDALQRFVERVLQPSTRNRFLIDLAPLARKIAYDGSINSLAQTLLKLTSPGVPDIYQGNEVWDFSLVDPDNRRPVDYVRRAELLKQVKAAARRKEQGQLAYAQEIMQQWHDGRIKLWVTQRTLRFRRDHDNLFTGGDYVPLEAVGERAQHICAYLRQPKGTDGDNTGPQAIVIVPRLVATLTKPAQQNERPPLGAEIWGDTALLLPTGARAYANLFTGERIPSTEGDGKPALRIADVLGNFPVALLTPQG